MVPLNVHNALDYVIGVVLLLSPYIFGFSEVGAASNLFLVGGLAIIGYSLITNYRYSALKIIPLGVHMAMDVALGALIVLGPYVFGYRDLITGGQTLVHYALGIAAFLLVAMTRPKTEQGKVLGTGAGELTGRDKDWRKAA